MAMISAIQTQNLNLTHLKQDLPPDKKTNRNNNADNKASAVYHPSDKIITNAIYKANLKSSGTSIDLWPIKFPREIQKYIEAVRAYDINKLRAEAGPRGLTGYLIDQIDFQVNPKYEEDNPLIKTVHHWNVNISSLLGQGSDGEAKYWIKKPILDKVNDTIEGLKEIKDDLVKNGSSYSEASILERYKWFEAAMNMLKDDIISLDT